MPPSSLSEPLLRALSKLWLGLTLTPVHAGFSEQSEDGRVKTSVPH